MFCRPRLIIPYMAKRLKVNIINPDIIRELADKFPEEAEKERKKYKSFDKWLRGEDFPTYNQLVGLSKIFGVPFGDFFLERLPETEFPIPHYRTFEGKEEGEF